MGFQRVTGMIFWIWRGRNTEQKIEQSTDKNVEFQQDEHFEASKFHIGLRVLQMK